MTYNKYDFEARAFKEPKAKEEADDKKRAERKAARRLKFMLAEAEKKKVL